MKSKANVEDLRNKVVSDGTMRPEDLIPKFLGVLKEYAPDRYDAYVKENPEVLDLKGMDDETMGWVVDELFDKLNEIAPEGYSFGSQDGDGACYGFWSVDADESKKCEDVPEIKVGDFVEYDKNGKEDWNWAEVTGVNEDGTLNLHITDMDKTNYADVDNVPVASCHKLPRFAGMTDTGHYYMDGPINLYKGGWEICVTKKDLDPSKYEFIGTIDSYEDMPQVDAYYDDNYVYDEDDESEVREYFGIDFPEGAVTFADFKGDVVGESCVKADGRSAESKKCEAYIQPVTLYSTTRYDDAEAVQSFLRDIGGDAVTVDKQRNGDVLSVNVSGSDDDVEAFVDTYKNEYGSIVKDCEVDAMGWTAPEDIYYIATEQGRKELRGESKKGESAGETMRVDVYADRRNFDPEEFVKYVRMAGGKNGGYISVDSVVSVDVLNKANRLAQTNDYKRTESKKFEARPTKQEEQIKELCKLCRNDKNVAESVFKALTKDYNTSLDPVLAGQYLTAKWKSKLEELGGCNGWYDGFKKLYAAMGLDFVCSVLQDLKLGSSGIGCGACITIVNNIYDKVVKRNEANKSEGDDEEAFGKFEDAVKSILMDKYGVVDSHGPSDETANSLVLQYGATLRDAFDKGGENGYDPTSVALLIITRQLREAPQFFDDCKDFTFNKDPKKSESLTLKQKELKDMVRYGEAEDITTLPEPEAKELYKKGLETVGLSRGTYGLNGALLRDSEGKKYAITARSSNLFYFI